jgi:hypothetical protein
MQFQDLMDADEADAQIVEQGAIVEPDAESEEPERIALFIFTEDIPFLQPTPKRQPASPSSSTTLAWPGVDSQASSVLRRAASSRECMSTECIDPYCFVHALNIQDPPICGKCSTHHTVMNGEDWWCTTCNEYAVIGVADSQSLSEPSTPEQRPVLRRGRKLSDSEGVASEPSTPEQPPVSQKRFRITGKTNVEVGQKVGELEVESDNEGEQKVGELVVESDDQPDDEVEQTVGKKPATVGKKPATICKKPATICKKPAIADAEPSLCTACNAPWPVEHLLHRRWTATFTSMQCIRCEFGLGDDEVVHPDTWAFFVAGAGPEFLRPHSQVFQ